MSERRLERLNIPIGYGDWIKLDLPCPMTEKDWDQMMRVLEAMKVGLLREPAPVEELRPKETFTDALAGPIGEGA